MGNICKHHIGVVFDGVLHGQAEMTKGCVLCVTICNGAFLPLDNTVSKGCAIYLQLYAQVQIGSSSKKLQKILSATADPGNR